MVAIRKISVDKNELRFTDQKGVEHVFNASKIPQGKDTVQKLEDHINTVWLPPLLNGEMQMVVHIFSLSPLQLTQYSTNIGEKIPMEWWLD